jgi:hypothetical protein
MTHVTDVVFRLLYYPSIFIRKHFTNDITPSLRTGLLLLLLEEGDEGHTRHLKGKKSDRSVSPCPPTSMMSSELENYEPAAY